MDERVVGRQCVRSCVSVAKRESVCVCAREKKEREREREREREIQGKN